MPNKINAVSSTHENINGDYTNETISSKELNPEDASDILDLMELILKKYRPELFK